MAIRPILRYPHEHLLKKTALVEDFAGEEFQRTLKDLKDTMCSLPNCAGLAANQIGHSQHVFVMDPSDDKSEYRCFVNTRIVKHGEEVSMRDGCMSFPTGYWVLVKRYEWVDVVAQDEEGKEFEFHAEDIWSRGMQHETDHLEGITMLDRLSPLRRKMAERKLGKLLSKGR